MTQLRLPLRPVVTPPPALSLQLPARLLCYPFWQPYARLVLTGDKLEETRKSPWTRPAGWIAIYETQRRVRLPRGGVPAGCTSTITPARWVELQEKGAAPDGGGHVIGVVYVSGSRPMVPADFDRALFFEPGRHVWHLSTPRFLARPLTREEAGLTVAPQGPVYIAGATLEATGFAPTPPSRNTT